MAKKDIYNYEDVKSAMSGMNIAVFYLDLIKFCQAYSSNCMI